MKEAEAWRVAARELERLRPAKNEELQREMILMAIGQDDCFSATSSSVVLPVPIPPTMSWFPEGCSSARRATLDFSRAPGGGT